MQSIADGLVDRGIELVILGSGENQYETFFSDLCARHPGRVGTYIGFEPALSQEIYAGADAVSYTHLDVYKRQVHRMAHGHQTGQRRRPGL